MRKILYIIMCSLMLAACGNRHKATTVVDDFLKQNLRNTDVATKFLDMDSTHKVSDSIITVMQQQAQNDKAFKPGIRFEKPQAGKLYFLRLRIIQEKDTMVRTFYLDGELTHVVAFKQN